MQHMTNNRRPGEAGGSEGNYHYHHDENDSDDEQMVSCLPRKNWTSKLS